MATSAILRKKRIPSVHSARETWVGQSLFGAGRPKTVMVIVAFIAISRLAVGTGFSQEMRYPPELPPPQQVPKSPGGQPVASAGEVTVPFGDPWSLDDTVPTSVALVSPPAEASPWAKIAELEKKLAALPPDTFDFGLHNDLRHWYGAVAPKKSMYHVNIILKHSRFNDYMKQVLSGWHLHGDSPDEVQAIAALTAVAEQHPEFPNVAAACWIWAGDLSTDEACDFYAKAMAVEGLDAYYREAVVDLMRRNPACCVEIVCGPCVSFTRVAAGSSLVWGATCRSRGARCVRGFPRLRRRALGQRPIVRPTPLCQQ